MKNEVLCNLDSISGFKCFLFNLTVIGNLKNKIKNNTSITNLFLILLIQQTCMSYNKEQLTFV